MKKNTDWKETAKKFLSSLLIDNPSLFEAPRVPGKGRGLDYYATSAFLSVLSTTLQEFHFNHQRLPDLVNLPKTCDHFFKMKFFNQMLMRPNPASKLNARRYIPNEIKDLIRPPVCYWSSTTPTLPPDEEIPAGTYWLKLDLGWHAQEIIEWPPSLAERKRLNEKCESWMNGHRHGLANGEWWYGIGEQRIFLEEDLSEVILQGTEIKIFVRNGHPKIYHNVVYDKEYPGSMTVNYFDANKQIIKGTRSYGRNGEHTITDHILTSIENIDEYLLCAAEIGKPFDLVRVDIFTKKNSKPVLGELSFCVGSGTHVYHPDTMEETIRSALFE
ncbi:ATP-grasp fold amidoligase family protein [Solemya velum gill symbiont]|nr:ATP-grasp fold amidoligase family protein [Solemya velum gill symbiont]OOY49612.1 hypothetical protein BOV97_12660 [Solemya velum gill symbiont]OOY58911.1 hypothetical protein BOW02_12120 [Solemya velum gill symbiont]OOY59729.1 hypothetical protein BOW04_12055 [Solemya velum gill symbiont]OOY63418.1 hypothetical protein BOW05_12815 [Solemya velum gill symbiont]OOY64439.1 hypothetical protein BOW06_12580 [Solemya velum gill symbiont]